MNGSNRPSRGKLTAAVILTDDASFGPQYIWLTGHAYEY